MKPKKWTITELQRYDRILLQIAIYDFDLGEYEVIGTITLDDRDMESKVAWMKAVEHMNQEFSQKSS